MIRAALVVAVIAAALDVASGSSAGSAATSTSNVVPVPQAVAIPPSPIPSDVVASRPSRSIVIAASELWGAVASAVTDDQAAVSAVANYATRADAEAAAVAACAEKGVAGCAANTAFNAGCGYITYGRGPAGTYGFAVGFGPASQGAVDNCIEQGAVSCATPVGVCIAPQMDTPSVASTTSLDPSDTATDDNESADDSEDADIGPTHVETSGKNGNKTVKGVFELLSDGSWEETNTDNADWSYRVESQSPDTIELIDDARGVAIELDLAKNVVNYKGQKDKAFRFLYRITSWN